MVWPAYYNYKAIYSDFATVRLPSHQYACSCAHRTDAVQLFILDLYLILECFCRGLMLKLSLLTDQLNNKQLQMGHRKTKKDGGKNN